MKNISKVAEELAMEAQEVLPKEELDRVFADIITIPRRYANSTNIAKAISVGIIASALNRHALKHR